MWKTSKYYIRNWYKFISFVFVFFYFSVLVFGQTASDPYAIPKYKQQDLEIIMPDLIIEGVESEITVKIKDPAHPCLYADDYQLEVWVNGKEITVPVEENKALIPYVFTSDQVTIIVDQFTYHKSDLKPLPLWLSIIPPLLAILMALVFKEVISSIFLGIFSGAAILHCYTDGAWGILTGFIATIDTYIIESLNDWGHLAVIIFSMNIGAMVAIISRNGGMQGVVSHISKFAKDARSGQLATWLLGIAIFFDDYANTLVVGNTMRPVTDRLRISREKLAYIVDSTAAPIAAIAFVTTWIGAELGYIDDGLEKLDLNKGAYSIFVSSLQYSFYPVLTLIFILMLVLKNRDFGPMLKAERRVREEGITDIEMKQGSQVDDISEFETLEGVKIRAYNAIIPILVLIGGTVYGLLHTGFEATAEELKTVGIVIEGGWSGIWNYMFMLPDAPAGFFKKLGVIIGNSDSYLALLWASLGALVLSVLMTVGQKLINLSDTIATAISGYKTMLSAIMILVLAWSLAMVTDHMHTADFLTGLMEGNIAPWFVPALTFILAALVAFSTGSSWGTMAILYPLILPAAWTVCQNAGYTDQDSWMIFYNVVSCVLAGSVLGDHCSPISDTTILSSLASSCNHIDHVRTQLPYALTVGVVSILIGTIPGALGVSSWITFPVALVVLFLVVRFFGKRVEVR